MKKLILTVALGVACVSAFAQGQLNFANFGAGANAPIFYTDGVTKLSGAAYSADLYWGAAGVTDSTMLTALGAPATFASSGYFLGGSRTIAGQTGTIVGQVRVWDTASGSSWAAAVASGLPNTVVGESVLFNISLTQPPTTPNTLTGLNGNSFSLHPVPEPSTLALAGLGLAGLMVLRRRK